MVTATQKAWVSRQDQAAREMAEQTTEEVWIELVVDSFDLCARHARLHPVKAGVRRQPADEEPGDFVVEIGRRCGVTLQSDCAGSRRYRHDVRYTFSADNGAGFVRAEIAASGRVVKRDYWAWNLTAARAVLRDVNESDVMWFLIEPVPLLVRAAAGEAQAQLGGGW